MKFLDTEGVRQLKELNDAAYVGKEEYNDDTMVISAALNDLNSRVTTAESEIAGFSGGDENIIETVKVNGTALTVTDKAVDVTVPTTLASLTDDSTHRLVTDTEKTTWSGKANTASPAFTGTPTAPTAAAGTNNTQIATTAFVQNVAGSTPKISARYEASIDVSGPYIPARAYSFNSVTDKSTGNTISVSDVDYTKAIEVHVNWEGEEADDPRYTPYGTLTMLFTYGVDDMSGSYTSSFGIDYYTPIIVETNCGLQMFQLQIGESNWYLNVTDINLMTSSEKTKLQGIAAGAEVNVQSDWSVTDSTSDAYIANKPTIPTKVSDLTNDSGFTTNIGTITGITMNGTSKGTSGVVDLGTVITDVSGKADASAAIGTLSLAIDNTNYQITLSGTKVDGTTFTVSNVIDLPLESVVVNGSYNNTTKKVVLTLQNGNTVDFSVADLVAGLQSEITSTNKLSADLISDGTTNKVVTATEKSTWSGKQDALNAGTFNVMQNGVTAGTYSINQSGNSSANIIVPTKVSDLTNDSGFTANTGTITSVKMNGSTVSSSGEADLGTVITSHATRKLTATNSTATAGGSTITYVESLTGTNTATSGDLTVTATRKTVTIPSAPGTLKTNNTTAQTASASESLSGTINLHKVAKTGTYSDLIGTPTIPTVNNSTISIQKGGTAVDSFTTNAASAKTINIPNELPTYSSSDSGKILSVNSSGALVWITPSYIYSGSSAPSNSTGNNGDLYLQTS